MPKEPAFNWRIPAVGGVMLLCLGVLLGKLSCEQLTHTDEYRHRIERQSIRRIRIPAKRGKIISSDGEVFAESTPGCNLVIYPENIRKPGRRSNTVKEIMRLITECENLLARQSDMNEKKVIEHLNMRPGIPMIIFQNATLEEIAKILERAPIDLTGVEVEETEARRSYLFNTMASHILGYTRRDIPAEALDRSEFFYYLPDLVGRTGLELWGNSPLTFGGQDIRRLRGEPGCRVVQVDNLGFVRQTLLSEVKPQDGNHLILTLDFKAQRAAENQLLGKRGSFVALNADTGEVIAMASSPNYNLNEFTPRLSPEYYNSLTSDKNIPMLNRSLRGTYTPGSILKVLIAMALLENGVDPYAEVNCPGMAHIGNAFIRCAAVHGHGKLNMYQAIERSCNVYFIEKGMALGIDNITRMLMTAHLGSDLPLELTNAAGKLPKFPIAGSRWTQFDTALVSIGQGEIAITPLQAVSYTAAVANGGKIMRPYLVKSIVDSNGQTLYNTQSEVITELGVKPETLAVVREGMRLVVASSSGSGRRARSEKLQISGKTGSAEVGPRNNRTKNTWFVGYCNINGVNYAAAMLVEEGISGGSDCAPLVKAFFESLLGQ